MALLYLTRTDSCSCTRLRPPSNAVQFIGPQIRPQQVLDVSTPGWASKIFGTTCKWALCLHFTVSADYRPFLWGCPLQGSARQIDSHVTAGTDFAFCVQQDIFCVIRLGIKPRVLSARSKDALWHHSYIVGVLPISGYRVYREDNPKVFCRIVPTLK